MKVCVFGLGYVGAVSAACLAHQGFRVVGVDINQQKVDQINAGKSPIIEEKINEILADSVAQGLLTATSDTTEALRDADVSLICVGTPSHENGSLDLQYIQNVSREIGRALKTMDQPHVVAVRSTMLPGSLEDEVVPLVEMESGRSFGDSLGFCLNPEFLREGSAVSDYFNPPFTLIGSRNPKDASVLEKLYDGVSAKVINTDIRTAAMVKYASNTFHALKVAFANEIGLFCKNNLVDSHRVMDIFTDDTHLNISARYLKPGFAFGGSCLPKDIRALSHRAKSLDLELPVINSLLQSNNRHIDHAFTLIQRTGKRRIGLLGLAFKAGTDDLRESPMVRLVELLIGKGYDIRIYDPTVSLAAIVGANRDYIEQVIPHISTLLVTDTREILDYSELVILGNVGAEFGSVVEQLNDNHVVIDLAYAIENPDRENFQYEGLCW